MKSSVSIVIVLMVGLLALVPNVNATTIMDGYNWTGLQNILGLNNLTSKQIGGVIYADQYATIQDAINACPVAGCVVDAGVNRSYSISQLLIQRNDIKLIGENVTLVGTNPSIGAYQGIVQIGYGLGITTQVRNIVFDGFNIDGSKDTNRLFSIIGAKNVKVNNLKILTNTTPGDAPIFVIGDGMNSGASAQSQDIFFDNVDIDGTPITNTASAMVIGGGYGGKIAVDNIQLNRMNVRNFPLGSGIRVFTYSSRLAKNIYVTNSNFTNLSQTSTALFAVGSESGIIGFWVLNNRFENLYSTVDGGTAIMLHATYSGFVQNNYLNNAANTFAIGGSSANADIWSRDIDISGNTINNSNAMDWDSSSNIKTHHNTWRNTDCNVAGLFGVQNQNSFKDNNVFDSWTNRSVGTGPQCVNDPVNNNFIIGIADSGVVVSGNEFKQSVNGSTNLQYGIFQEVASAGGEHPEIYNNRFVNISHPIGNHTSVTTNYVKSWQNFNVAGYYHGNSATTPTPFGFGDEYSNSTSFLQLLYNNTAWNPFMTLNKFIAGANITLTMNSTDGTLMINSTGGSTCTDCPNATVAAMSGTWNKTSLPISIENGTNVIGSDYSNFFTTGFAGTITKLISHSTQSGSINVSFWNASNSNSYIGSVAIAGGTDASTVLSYPFADETRIMFNITGAVTDIKQVGLTIKATKS